MTLEDKHYTSMGGRKDDVSRTPKQNRKRPLSAVLEEFEVEDDLFKEHFTNNNNNTEDRLDGNDKNNADDRAKPSSEVSVCRGETNERQSSDTKTSSSPLTSVSVSSLKALFEAGNVRATEGRQTSPKIPRKLSQRRQTRSPSLSPKIPRRSSSGFYSSSSDVSDDEIPTTSDMTRLRQMADRLCLSTRRPSVQQWRAQYVDRSERPVLWNSGQDDVSGQNGDEGGRWTEERTQRINAALDWIKNELQEMRTQDQQLARQLLTIRSDLHRLKLARSCEEHRDMLDDVQFELEELQEFADVLDLPTPTFSDSDSPLKHLGVTRMNFSARRFSTC